MSVPRRHRVVLGLAAVLVAVLGALLGRPEVAVLLGALAWIVATAWLPRRAVRALGSLWLALLVLALARFALGGAGALVLAAAVGATAAAFAPTRVHRRVAFTVPLLLLLVFVVTVLLYLAPGSPFSGEKVASMQVQAAQKAKFGVSDTALGFFATYVRRLLLEGSLGDSIQVQGRSVLDLIGPAFPVSMSLGLLALTLAVAGGLLLGIRAGLRPGSLPDHASMAVALLGISLPNFVIGALLLVLFALRLGWLPVAGWDGPANLVLPALTLAFPYVATIARLARTGTIEVMQQDFIRTARAKGLPERRIVGRHALKGALLPVVSYLGPAAAGIFTGSFVVEHLFGIPGMGQWFVRGASGRDHAVVLGTALVYFTIITLFNLVVDLAYTWLDPRVRETP